MVNHLILTGLDSICLQSYVNPLTNNARTSFCYLENRKRIKSLITTLLPYGFLGIFYVFKQHNV